MLFSLKVLSLMNDIHVLVQERRASLLGVDFSKSETFEQRFLHIAGDRTNEGVLDSKRNVVDDSL